MKSHRRRHLSLLREHLESQNWCCYYCGRKLVKAGNGIRNCPGTATLDHVTPISKGGFTCWTNTVAACDQCNHAKGDMTLEQFQRSHKYPRRKRAPVAKEVNALA